MLKLLLHTMEIKFYEMHFQPTETLSSDADKASFALLRMTPNSQTLNPTVLCSVCDKVYQITWNEDAMELGTDQVFVVEQSGIGANNVVVSLHVLHEEDTPDRIIVGVVYGQGVKWVITVFQFHLGTREVSHKSEDTLPSKPNLLFLSRDVNTDNITVYATFYSEPCVEMFTYSISGYLTKVESDIIKRYYPGLYKCRGTIDRRNSSMELKRVPDFIICMDTLIYESRRYLVYGTVEGKVHLNVSSSTEPLWHDMYDWEGPISSVKLFTTQGQVCLVVCCMVQQVVLFTDITTTRLSDELVLPESTLYDSPTCVTVMDIDYDGHLEVLVGTYGCWFLVYKLDSVTTVRPGLSCAGGVRLVYRRQFNSPIYGICYSDVTDDGLYELVLLSFNGIHVLQRCLSAAKSYIDGMLYTLLPRSRKQLDSVTEE